MKKDNFIDALISAQLKKSRKKCIPPETECPAEDTILSFIHGERTKEEEKLARHFHHCTECRKTLGILMDIEQAQANLREMPETLYAKAGELLEGPPAKPEVHKETKALLKKITLLWDKVGDKMSCLQKDLIEGMLSFQEAVPQPSRKYEQPKEKQDSQEDFYDFPYSLQVETVLGPVSFEIANADKEGFLILTVSSLAPGNISSDIGIRLYKGKILNASVSFADGRAFFPRLKEGDYRIEFFDDRGAGENIELPILVKKTP